MFTKVKLFVVSLLATILLATTAFAQYVPVEDSYKIKPEDEITVRVENVEEVSGTYIVGLDGRFTMPYLGSLYVVGMTTQDLTKKLTDSLKVQIKDPKVVINIKGVAIDRVYMMGAIKTQGPIGWKPGWRMTEAIASAGGLVTPPERTKCVLWRVGTNHVSVNLRKLLIDGDDTENIKIEPGDVINFQTDVTTRLQVVGEVHKAGILEVLEGQGIAEAVAAAGGQTELARLTGAKLMRKGKEVPIDLYGAVIKGEPELDVPVQENDTLYIPTLLTRIAVIGSVGKPGPIGIQDGRVETLTDAIGLAGGFSPRAKREGVTVYSKDATGKSSSKNYNVAAMFKSKDLKGDPVLHDGDIVYVAESGKPGEQDLGVVFGAINMLRFFVP